MKSNATNNFVLTSFYVLLIVTSFDLIFEENIRIPLVYSILKAFDEVLVVFLFVITLLAKRRLERVKLLKIMVLFSIAGMIGNVISRSTATVCLMGLYTTIKPIMFYWTLCQFDFEWDQFNSFLKKIGYLFPIVVVSYILDLIIPSFRSDIGIVAQAVDIRMGFRSLGGLFNRFTIGILFALLYYIMYKYYAKKSKWKVYFASFMIFASFKVKDIAGFVFGNLFLFFHKFKKKYVIVFVGVMMVAFNVYAMCMPEHYSKYFSFEDDSNVARVVLVQTAAKIVVDKFPFGVGHGMYASPISRQQKSHVYDDYKIDRVYGLNLRRDGGAFMCDSFWPMVLGESGALGTLLYLMMMYYVFKPSMVGFFRNTADKRYVFPAFLFIVFLFASLGKSVFNGPPHCFVVWGFAGVFYSLQKKNDMQVGYEKDYT